MIVWAVCAFLIAASDVWGRRSGLMHACGRHTQRAYILACLHGSVSRFLWPLCFNEESGLLLSLQGAESSYVTVLGAENFTQAITAPGKITLVEFYAPW